MPVKVVDASAAGALLFGEPAAGEVADRLQKSRLVAPALFPKVDGLCASYLWLARKLGAELVTLDRGLSLAAKS